jgi:spermidine synthase
MKEDCSVKLRGVIFLLFFLSGALGLVYEITWMRQFRIIMGNTVYTSATVLTAFMGGLALGSFVAGRVVDRLRRPLRAYGILELLIGAYAVLLPWLMIPADPLYGWLYRNYADTGPILAFGRFAISCALLLPPATMMGATLPLLTRYLAEGLQWVGRDVGRLYGINTIGAALGAAVAGFAFVPLGGVGATLLTGAAGSVSIGLFALFLDRRHDAASVIPSADDGVTEGRDPLRHAVVWGLGLAGVASMIYEVAWTRTLTQLIGSSVYAFTLMLVAFISGLGLGAVTLSGFIDRRRNPVLFLGVLQVVVAATCLIIVPLFGRAPPLVVDLITTWANSFGALHTAQFITIFLLMLIPTFAMGGVFPTVARIYARDPSGIGRSVGEVYAANTLGSVVGSFVAGFVLIPWVGVRSSILIAVGLNAVLGAAFWLASGWRTPRVRNLCVGLASLLFATAMVAVPRWDTHLINSAPYLYAYRYKANARTQGTDLDQVMTGSRLLYEEEGLTATVTVVESGAQLFLKVNGKTDASSRGDLRSQSLLSHLPALLHPDPRQTLLIGLGSGISLGALEHHPVQRIECVEISPEVVHAAQLFSEVNGDALADDRVHMIIGDGRNHTAHVDGVFDVIISQPSNLWIAGMADLFTVEFFQACRTKLAAGGLMCSWVQAYSMTRQDFLTVVSTFAAVFPHISLWESVPGGDYFLVGSESPLSLSYEQLSQRIGDRPGLQSDLERIGVGSLGQILSCYVAADDDLRRLVVGVGLNTDDNANLEFSAPRGLAQGLIGGSGLFGPDDLDAYRIDSLSEILQDASLPATLQQSWEARALARLSQVRMNEQDLTDAVRQMDRAVQKNPADMEVRRLYPLLAAAAGREWEQRGELDRALGLYANMLLVAPEDAKILLRLGKIHQRQGRDNDALVAFEKSVTADPGFLSARIHLAGLHARLGHLGEAEAQYQRATTIEPENSLVFNEWGKFQLRQRRWDDAIHSFETGLALAPEQAQLANNLGVAWAQKGELATAATWYSHAVDVQPEYTRAWVNLGDAYRALLRGQESRHAYQEALRIEPKNQRALRGLRGL